MPRGKKRSTNQKAHGLTLVLKKVYKARNYSSGGKRRCEAYEWHLLQPMGRVTFSKRDALHGLTEASAWLRLRRSAWRPLFLTLRIA